MQEIERERNEINGEKKNKKMKDRLIFFKDGEEETHPNFSHVR